MIYIYIRFTYWSDSSRNPRGLPLLTVSCSSWLWQKYRELICGHFIPKMATPKTVKDVSPHDFVKSYSAHLRRSGKVLIYNASNFCCIDLILFSLVYYVPMYDYLTCFSSYVRQMTCIYVLFPGVGLVFLFMFELLVLWNFVFWKSL